MPRPVRLFHVDDYMRPEEAFHFARKTLDRRPPAALHTHDYYEVMLVEHGRTAHWINGEEEALEAGDLLLARPADTHGFAAMSAGGCGVVNVMFRQATAESLLERYRADLAGRFFWTQGARPAVVRLEGERGAEIARAIRSLRDAPRGDLWIEQVLLAAMTRLLHEAESVGRSAPDWLAGACAAARRPEALRRGVDAFVEATGRCHAHVCRETRRHLGMTPTQYVNALRLRHAATLLGDTALRLEEVAEACGFANMSHFHKLFRETYETGPADYRRRRHRDPVGSPVGEGT